MIIVLVTSKLFNFYNFSGLDGTTSLSAFSSRSDTDAYHFVSPLEVVFSPLSSTTTEYDFKSVTQLVSGEALALRISKIPWCHGQIRL